MNLEFLIERYDRELDRRDKLTAAVNFPVTILVLLGSAIVTMTQSISLQSKTLSIGLFVFVVFGAAMMAWALWNFSWAYHGQEYEFLPRLHELEETHDEFDPEQFNDHLRRAIIDATDSNTKANDIR